MASVAIGAGGDLAMSNRSAIAAVLQRGRIRPAAPPRAGQMAPKMWAERVR